MIKDGETVIGSQCKAKIVKNKVAPPFKQAEFEIMYDKGISWEGSLLDMGILCGVVEKSGSWLGYAGNRLGQGRENAKKFLVENPAIGKEIHEKIMSKQDELIKSDVLKAEPEGSEKPAAADAGE
jgi:recombination protein RecA